MAMSTVEKSGMLINSNKEVIGWVNKGEQVEMKDGDMLVSHFKTAEKHGLLEQFNELKAENAPVKAEKAPKEKGEAKARGPRTTIPKTGTYSVIKTPAAPAEGAELDERGTILNKLLTNSDFATFWEGAPEKFNHPDREGNMKEFATSGLVGYAIRRGFITVDAVAAE